MTPDRRDLARGEAGFSLLEVVLAMAILAGALTVVVYGLTGAYASTAAGRVRQRALVEARSVVEQVRALPPEDVGLDAGDLARDDAIVAGADHDGPCPVGSWCFRGRPVVVATGPTRGSVLRPHRADVAAEAGRGRGGDAAVLHRAAWVVADPDGTRTLVVAITWDRGSGARSVELTASLPTPCDACGAGWSAAAEAPDDVVRISVAQGTDSVAGGFGGGRAAAELDVGARPRAVASAGAASAWLGTDRTGGGDARAQAEAGDELAGPTTIGPRPSGSLAGGGLEVAVGSPTAAGSAAATVAADGRAALGDDGLAGARGSSGPSTIAGRLVLANGGALPLVSMTPSAAATATVDRDGDEATAIATGPQATGKVGGLLAGAATPTGWFGSLVELDVADEATASSAGAPTTRRTGRLRWWDGAGAHTLLLDETTATVQQAAATSTSGGCSATTTATVRIAASTGGVSGDVTVALAASVACGASTLEAHADVRLGGVRARAERRA